MQLEQSMPWKMSGHQPFTFCVNGIHWMLSGVFATTATMELWNLFLTPILLRLFKRMVYAETKGKYEEFYQDLLSDATAKISGICLSFGAAMFYKIRKVHKVFQNGKQFALTWSQYQQYHWGFNDLTLNSFNVCEHQIEMLKDASYYKLAEPVQMQC